MLRFAVSSLRFACGSLRFAGWRRRGAKVPPPPALRRPPDLPDRSTGAQETFGHDLSDREDIVRELLRLSARVTRRMRRAGTVGRTIALTVRFTDFKTISRSRTLLDPTDVTQEVQATVARLYDELNLRGRALRLVGVRVEHLIAREGTDRQLVLGARERGWSEADRATDRVAERFGSSLVRRASLLSDGQG
ncbi:hypothetical protein [Nocardioides sp. NPDC006273]|uniref:DinB/UmuC family translesion DNA polymerase n=1 Tax=Nocardioides sp. NPDC006273 TaxID=3155598 RepID=UPI0033B9DC78